MSKNNDNEEEENKEEEEDSFYESLDRILSSSNSSTSASEDDDAVLNSPSYSRDHHTHSSKPNLPKICEFPACIHNYGLWISESFSCSVEQRRDRLLRALGLASDSSLSRRKSSILGNGHGSRFDFGQSVSSDRLNAGQSSGIEKNSCNFGIFLCKSEDSTDCHSVLDQRNSFISSSSILSIRLVSDVVKSSSGDIDDKNSYNKDSTVVVDNLARNGSVGLWSSSNNAPMVKGCRWVDNIRIDSENLSPNCCCKETMTDCRDNCGEDGECNRIVEVVDPMCTIKNLDNGKQFVVNEVREDGMWKKLKEVGTGRQLTMEEFEMFLGHSPIVQELMRRQNVEEHDKDSVDPNINNGSKLKKKASWFRSIKCVATGVRGLKERRSSDEKDTSSEKGGRRSSSATDDSQDASFHGPEKVRVRQYGKSVKELSALYKSQEIQAHNGSIWTIKFSLDGRYLASAGEDCMIHVWQVLETERKGGQSVDRPDDGSLNLLFLTNGSPEPNSASPNMDNLSERKRRARKSMSRKSMSLDHIVLPETVFGLSEKPFCSFTGHLDHVLDLSWSKSQLLLSSSMDKTVRLWNLTGKTCLKIFSHSDYVTCIQFNPVDDRYFISGSLDAKVRIWSIPDRQVVDWNDLHEMVTAACYTPDGQGALVGSYKGSCRLYNTSENKLQQKCQINLQNKKKKSHLKKITGFQFAPGSSSEVLVTSADSRIRVIDGVDLVHKFKGFRNTNSPISAAVTTDGKYVVCGSEDSHVYVWKHEGGSRPSRSKDVTVTRSYEHFHCQDVSVAIPWPGFGDSFGLLPETNSGEQNGPFHEPLDESLTANHPPTPVDEFNGTDGSPSVSGSSNSPFRATLSSATNSYFFDRFSATWPEEKLLLPTKNRSTRASLDPSKLAVYNTAWGMVIVTAGLRGEIRTFQNFGLPVRI
ncbi:hypothetical protein Nepgr_027377 [Nepenthes gracilis]|uniref:WD repeat-containing protein 44 n=1 Tax=Nepenthes gracilis TaxID=150966 RepID=A0AAD3TAP9_NEPGR|nr:hypothetical protein Nepgr_027377 [Nepenthes gracilis]